MNKERPTILVYFGNPLEAAVFNQNYLEPNGIEPLEESKGRFCKLAANGSTANILQFKDLNKMPYTKIVRKHKTKGQRHYKVIKSRKGKV